MKIDRQRSTFVFALRGGRVHLQSCRNVTLKNLYLDMEHPPFIQGTIRAIDQAKRAIDFSVDDGFPSLDQAAFSPGKVRHVIMDRRGTRELPLPDAIHGPPTEVKPGLLRANPFRLFKEKGYVSAAIDTWHLGVEEGSEALKRGFNFRHGNDSGSGDYFTARTCCFQTSLTYFI